MNDPVAVLRRMLQHRFAWADCEEGIAALDHAIAAVAERDALVARLGELEKAWRERAAANYALNNIAATTIANTIAARVDDLARVVKENTDG